MTFSALFLHIDYLKVTGLPLLFLRNSLETNLLCLAPYRILFPPDPPILPTVHHCRYAYILFLSIGQKVKKIWIIYANGAEDYIPIMPSNYEKSLSFIFYIYSFTLIYEVWYLICLDVKSRRLYHYFHI